MGGKLHDREKHRTVLLKHTQPQEENMMEISILQIIMVVEKIQMLYIMGKFATI